jgi:hypothetical protein
VVASVRRAGEPEPPEVDRAVRRLGQLLGVATQYPAEGLGGVAVKYFPTKEDLVLHRFADHQCEAARVVRGRSARQSPIAALRRHFLRGLADRDPVTGLNDHPEVLAYHRMVFATPSLALRLARYAEADEDALTEALREVRPARETADLTARLAAGQIIAVHRVLARENWRQLTAGRRADDVHPEAVRAADRAFGLLRGGLGVYDKVSALPRRPRGEHLVNTAG